MVAIRIGPSKRICLTLRFVPHVEVCKVYTYQKRGAASTFATGQSRPSSCRPDFPVTYQGADLPQARRRACCASTSWPAPAISNTAMMQ